MRIKLYAAAVRTKNHSTRLRPRCRVFRKPPIVLIQPKGSSIPLSLDHADGVAGMPGRAAIDRRAAVGIILRDVRGTAALAAAGDEVGSVVEIVGPHRAAGLGIVLDHVERGGVLGGAVGLGQPGINDEIVPVLHPSMAIGISRSRSSPFFDTDIFVDEMDWRGLPLSYGAAVRPLKSYLPTPWTIRNRQSVAPRFEVWWACPALIRWRSPAPMV